MKIYQYIWILLKRKLTIIYLHNYVNLHENLNSIIQWPKSSPSCSEGVLYSSLCFVSFCSRSLYLVVEKFVKGKISFGIFCKEIDASILDIVPGRNIYEFSNNIIYFHNVCVCCGSPKLEEFPNCTIYTTRKLRHNLCRLVLKNNANACSRRVRIRNTLHMLNEGKSSKTRENLLLSPSKKIVVIRLRQIKDNLKKKKRIRANQKIISLKFKLNKVHNEMANISDESIKEKLNICQNMNEYQKTLILEYFAACKVKNCKSQTYTEN